MRKSIGLARGCAPISGARVWVPRPSAGGLLVSWATGNVAQTDSLEDGTFRLSGLTNDACTLRIEAPNAARTLVPLYSRFVPVMQNDQPGWPVEVPPFQTGHCVPETDVGQNFIITVKGMAVPVKSQGLPESVPARARAGT